MVPAKDDVTSLSGIGGDANRGPAAFTTTHWSMVLEAQGESPAAQEALEKLCRTYWRPIYSFVRRQGAGAEDAEDLTQGFFALVLERKDLNTVRKEKVKLKKVLDGVEKEVEEVIEKKHPGYLEAVYHLYSMEKKHGPVILRLRTENRTDKVRLPSLTPVWRSAEFQEREIFDLYGIIFDGHPDLRRILMWDEFEDHPMRKDYIEPDDYEYEPTAHDSVLAKAKQHNP